MKIDLVDVDRLSKFDGVEELLAAAPALGLTAAGVETSPHLRQELIGLPKFKELAGPMGGGETPEGEFHVRYETWKANKLYSS